MLLLLMLYAFIVLFILLKNTEISSKILLGKHRRNYWGTLYIEYYNRSMRVDDGIDRIRIDLMVTYLCCKYVIRISIENRISLNTNNSCICRISVAYVIECVSPRLSIQLASIESR